jgi:hypothetical protein
VTNRGPINRVISTVAGAAEKSEIALAVDLENSRRVAHRNDQPTAHAQPVSGPLRRIRSLLVRKIRSGGAENAAYFGYPHPPERGYKKVNWTVEDIELNFDTGPPTAM